MKPSQFALAGLAALFISHGSVRAEMISVTIPGQGWYVSMDAPALKMFRGQNKEKDFQYMAAGEQGFNLSIFVEPPKGAGKTHQDCYDHYWPLAKRNHMIDQDSVKMVKTDAFIKVSYIIKPEGQDKAARNANYYVAFKDRWIDVHVSVFPSGEKDDEIFDAFEKSLKFADSSNKP